MENNRDKANLEFADKFSDLQEANRNFAAGIIKPALHVVLREAAIVGALQAVAESMGVHLQTPLAINGFGDVSFVAVHPDGRDPKEGHGNFGEEFARLLTGHRPRTGTSTIQTLTPENGWCTISHSAAERLVTEHAAHL